MCEAADLSSKHRLWWHRRARLLRYTASGECCSEGEHEVDRLNAPTPQSFWRSMQSPGPAQSLGGSPPVTKCLEPRGTAESTKIQEMDNEEKWLSTKRRIHKFTRTLYCAHVYDTTM